MESGQGKLHFDEIKTDSIYNEAKFYLEKFAETIDRWIKENQGLWIGYIPGARTKINELKKLIDGRGQYVKVDGNGAGSGKTLDQLFKDLTDKFDKLAAEGHLKGKMTVSGPARKPYIGFKKFCIGCKKVKEPEEFKIVKKRSKRHPDGLTVYCRACIARKNPDYEYKTRGGSTHANAEK